MKKLQTIIFKWNYLFILLLFLIALVLLLSYYIRVSVKEKGEAQVDLLMQVAQRSKVINKAAETFSNVLYLNSASELLKNSSAENQEITSHIDKLVTESNYYFDGMDMDLSALIIMSNNYQYISSNELTKDTNEIKNNYWYINNFNNKKNEFWIMRFGDTTSKTNCMISYGRVIRDSNGSYEGVVLVNAAERTFFKIYADIITEGSTVYILDEDGYAISHPIKDLIGVHLFYMPAFYKTYGENTYKFDIRKQLLISTYQDPTTGWMFVQESSFKSVFGKYYAIVAPLVFIILLFLLFGAIISYTISKKISRPLNIFADKLHNVSDAKLYKVDTENSYEEINKINTVYNDMVEKIQQLIQTIKNDEKLKRKNELDFLQLQINPHFLRNTLFSIKCLTEMGRYQDAGEMISSFMLLLKRPIATENEFIKFYDEVETLRAYAKLMSYRYNNASLEIIMEEEAKDCLVPRLLLQPIIENAFFHGLEEENSDFTIDLFAYVDEDMLIVRIRDNGIGMTQNEIEEIWDGKIKSGETLHSIGLMNIKSRIAAIYGKDGDLQITSQTGEGTEVELRLKIIEHKSFSAGFEEGES